MAMHCIAMDHIHELDTYFEFIAIFQRQSKMEGDIEIPVKNIIWTGVFQNFWILVQSFLTSLPPDSLFTQSQDKDRNRKQRSFELKSLRLKLSIDACEIG